MSKYKCSCGFDDGTYKGLDEHMWEIFTENREKRRRGEKIPKLDPDHIASWSGNG